LASNVGKPIAEQLGTAKDWTWRILAISAMLLLFWAWKTRGSSRRVPEAQRHDQEKMT
jgi:predicted MFS family arabinose efflux permease